MGSVSRAIFAALLCGLCGRSAAQITGAACKKFDPRNGTVVTDAEANALYASGAVSEPITALCIPKQCPAPNLHRGNNLYVFEPDEDNRSLDIHWQPGFNGYFYEQICDNVLTANASLGVRRGTGDKLARDYAKGCAAMYPLPDLAQSTCQSMIPLWIILIIYIFWALALVCEEFLVPAISILCTKLDIPDNVAGATLLAAGCNAPELFASIIAIYISNSPVGVGTVVGSAPFNVCCITSGSALAVGGVIYLDPWLMGRETLGLLVPAILFLVFLDDYVIWWWEAGILVFYYIFIYVPILANFDAVKANILRAVLAVMGGAPVKPEGDDVPRIGMAAGSGDGGVKASNGGLSAFDGITVNASGSQRGSFSGMRGAVAQSLSNTIAHSARSAFEVPSATAMITSQRLISIRTATSTDASPATDRQPPLPPLSPDLAPELMPAGAAPGLGESAQLDPETEANLSVWHSLAAECRQRCDGYTPPLSEPMEGVLLKKSRFYSKVRVTRLKWQMRHFVIDNHPTNPCRYSRVDKTGEVVNLKKFVTIPLQTIQTIERASLVEIHLVAASSTYKFRVPYADQDEAAAGAKAQVWFDRFVVKIDEMRKAANTPLQLAGEEEDDEGHEAWDKVPEGALSKFFFYATFPLKWAIFMTTPFVMHKSQEHKYIRCAIISSGWLAVLAFGMTECVEYLGCAIAIEPTAMGLSLGAIGTSFPNLYASILVAKAGDGVTAVCQAIASNTFNICIGLGVFWMFKGIGLTSCNYGSDGRSHQGPCNGCYGPVGSEPLCPYLEGTNNDYGSSSGSTKGAILVVFLWMVGFIGVMVAGKCTVTRVPAYFMAALYALYMLYQILTAYGVPMTICFSALNICI